MVCEQTCSCFHKMDKRLWQTFSAFDLVHSWETQHNNAEQDHFKILILQETWKIENQHQVDFCVFFEVKHLYR